MVIITITSCLFGVADYLSHVHFCPYELLDEAVMEERRCYALDLLRYLQVSGFELSLSRVSLSSLNEGTQATTFREKFALQLFQRFLDLLTQGKGYGVGRGQGAQERGHGVQEREHGAQERGRKLLSGLGVW